MAASWVETCGGVISGGFNSCTSRPDVFERNVLNQRLLGTVVTAAKGEGVIAITN